GTNEVSGHAAASAREPIEQSAIMGQPTEEVSHPVHSGEQTERSQQPFIGQPNAAGVHNGLIDPQGMPPLQVVPSRYPDCLTELLVENLNSNVNEMQMVPLYQPQSGGRQPMQYDVLAGGVQFNDGAEARPLTSRMHCGRRRTYATESVDEIRSVEETSQFPERNQAQRPITPGQICDGNYIWKIEGFRSLLSQSASDGIVTSLESPSIYTSLHGYKFFMRIFPRGIDGRDGRHIGLFVGIMQGEYDTVLDWPFRGRISLTIKDQRTDVHGFRQDISGTFMANRNQAAFQKPTAARRYKTLYGYAEFAPITTVCDPQYSKDGTVMIQVEIHNIP
ncbi:unnamed protein product, partial [Porites lobata]